MSLPIQDPDVLQLFERAKTIHINGDPNEAIPLYRQVIERDANCALAFNMLGNAYLDLGDLEEAVANYDDALQRDPDYASAHYNRGNAMCRLDRPREAVRAYRRAIELRPDFAPALFNLGNTYIELDEPGQAVTAYEEALKVHDDDYEVHFNLGKALMSLDRDTDAIIAFTRTMELQPSFAKAISGLGLCMLKTGRPRQAMMWFQRAAKLAPEEGFALFNIARTHFALAEYDDAEAVYREALRLEPDHPRSLECLGRTLVKLERPAEALELLDRWLELEPENPRALHLRDAWSGAQPDRASEAYVRQEFNAFAAEFDATLRSLDYRAPEIIRDMLVKARGTDDLLEVVVDLGCGTGLCGELLRPLADCLIGVDLSDRMLQRAHRRQLYDVLVTDDLTRYLKRNAGNFDALVAGDTLIYFGDLDEVLTSCAAALKPGGLLLFTLEQHEAPDVGATHHLKSTGRYGHHEPYVRELLNDRGLIVLEFNEFPVRNEGKDPVMGYAVLAQKPRSS